MSLRGALVRNQAPISFVSKRFSAGPMMGGYSDATSEIGAYGASGVLFAIVNRTANSVAAVNWHLHRKAPSAVCACCDEKGYQLVQRHAALSVWEKPNAFMTRQELVETVQQHVDLTGEGDIVMGHMKGFPTPIEMWPVRPDRIVPVPDPQKFLSGYIYRGPDGERVPLGVEDVVQLRMPNPGDPYRGLGPVQAVLGDIDSQRYSTEWNRRFFSNSAEPGGVIEVPEKMGDDEFEDFAQRWNDQHRGVSNAHRVAILENAKWVNRAYSQRDMQFVELSSVGDEKVRQAFGFPKPMLGATDDVNRANAEAAEVVFARWMLVPRLERWKGMLNAEFLPLFGATAKDLEFAYCNPVPPDLLGESAQLTARVNAVVALVGAGFDAEESCETTGLPVMVYARPAVPAPVAPPAAPEPMTEPDPAMPEDPTEDDPAAAARLKVSIENAMRWVAVEDVDDHTCDPCAANNGKLYRNREDAYVDYPNGEGFVNCIGAAHGNHCRGRVEKRKAD